MTPDGKLQIGDVVDDTCRQVSNIPIQLLKLDEYNKLRQLEVGDPNPLKNFNLINLIDSGVPNSLDNIKAAFNTNGLIICNPDFGKERFPTQLWLKLIELWTLLQSKINNHVFMSGAFESTYDSNVTEGNLLIVAVYFLAGEGSSIESATATVTDSLGNVYTQAGPYITKTPDTGPLGVSGYTAALFYTVSTGTGPCTVSVTSTISSYRFTGLLEYNPPHVGVTLDGATGQSLNSSGGYVNPSTGVMPGHTDGLAVGFFASEYTLIDPPSFLDGWSPVIGGTLVTVSGSVALGDLLISSSTNLRCFLPHSSITGINSWTALGATFKSP